MHVIRDHPLYGVGLGRLGDVLHARNPLSTSQHAHNLLLDWWAEAGPLALIAWIWLFAALIARSLRAALSGDVLGRGALAALVGFGGYSMLDHPANVDRIAIALWGMMGVAAALPRAPFAIPRLRRRHAHA
jgi:O-antigen ligase